MKKQSKRAETSVKPSIREPVVQGIRRWSLDEIANDLRKARRLESRDERQAALGIVNRQDWSPTYDEVREELGISGSKLTISAWVLKGYSRDERDY